MAGAIALRDLNSRRLTLRSTVALTATIALTALIGDARTRQARAIEQTAVREAGEPIMAIVSIKTQHITVYDAGGWTHRAPISTGKRGHETPAGVFAIVQKNADHRSNLYDDAWMPHMQRLTWNGIALHGGPLPGYAASHGCVRMPYGFAEKLFDKTRIGVRVIVSPNDTAPVDISHPALFMPDRERVSAALAHAEALAREAAEAARIDDETRRAAAAANRQVALLNASVRRLEWFKTRADADLGLTAKAFDAADAGEAKIRAEDVKLKAAAKAAEAEMQLATATADLKPKLDAAAEASAAVRKRSSPWSRYRSTSAEQRRSSMSGATRAGHGLTAAKCSMRPSRCPSQFAIRTSRLERTFSLRQHSVVPD
jgi:hypothetical protein